MHAPLRLASLLALVLVAGPALAESGALPAGSPFVHAGAPAPRTVSQKAVVTAELAAGVELAIDSRTPAMLVVLPHGEAKAAAGDGAGGIRIETPRGEVLRPGAALSGLGAPRAFAEPELGSYDLPSRGTVVDVALAPGRYTLRGSGLATVVVAEPGSPLQLEARTRPLGARAGEPVTIEATLTDGATPVAGAHVVARLADADGPRTILLTERGDGVYAATVRLAAKGLAPVDVRVDADGTLADGRPFRRTGSTGAMVAEGVADLTADGVALAGDRLQVPVSGRPGRYRVEATFGAANGADLAGLAWSAEDVELREADGGHTVVELEVPAAAAGADRVTVKLLNYDTLALERDAEIAVAVPGTPAFGKAERAALPASKREGRRLATREP